MQKRRPQYRQKLMACHYDNENPTVRQAFIFCLYCGLRFCNVKDLTFKNVDYANRLLKFEQSKAKEHSASSGVTADVGGHSYMNYLKVPAKVDELCAILQEKQKTVGAFREQYELSFNAHLNLVTIHPWVDGNGRTVRLLMNYIQFCYHLFPTKIFKEDREEYILSLHQCQDEETNQPFLSFMAGQLKKLLSLEIERFKASQKKVFSFMF